MNILLINNHSILNAGDYAILIETLRLIEAAFPGASVGLSFNDTESARAALPQHRIYRSPMSWTLTLDERGRYHLAPRSQRLAPLAHALASALAYRASGRVLAFAHRREQHELLAAFAAADLVLACGGGYIYAPGAREGLLGAFTFTLLGCVIALLMGKPLILLPQSIGPLHEASQRQFTRWVVRRAALTFTRERRSLALLGELGCAERTLCVPDLAFGLPGAPADQARDLLERVTPAGMQPAFRVGITAIDWGGQSYAFGGQQAYEAALLGCIDAITSQGGAVTLFAQCCGPSAAEDDRLVNARLRAQALHPERVVAIDEALPPQLLQAAYGTMDYFIGTRMHSVILALNAGVPSIAIGYLHKTRGMLEALGMLDRCLEIETLTSDSLIAAFEQLRRAPEQPGVAAYLARVARIKQALPTLLRGVCQNRTKGSVDA